MVARKRIIFQTIIALLFLLSIISMVNAEDISEQLINMNFKGADIRDVLRTVAELADVNLITDGSVEGVLTLHLKNISFIQALDLITQTHNLAYRWDGNTVVVATPERIEQLYGRVTTRTVKVKYGELAEIKGIVAGIYPEVNIQPDKQNSRLILKGMEESVDGALELIKKLDLAPEEKIIETLKIKYAEANSIREHFKAIYPELTVQVDRLNNQLILAGKREEINKAVELIKILDNAPKKAVKIVKVNFIDLNSLREKVSVIYPDLQVQADSFNNRVILSGRKEEITKAIALIEMLDTAPEKELIATIEVQYAEPNYLKEQLKSILPGLKVQADTLNNQLVISGKKEDIDRARVLVGKLDIPREEVAEIVGVRYTAPEELKNRISEILPEVKILVDKASQQLIITGRRKEVNSALSLIRKMDLLNKEVTEVVGINYLDLEEVKTMLAELYPGVKLQLNKLKKEMIVSGNEDMVGEVIALIQKLDTPRRQVIIEARIEEISRTELENIGVSADQLTQINFLKDKEGEFDGLSVSWPDFIKALEEKGTANTLANPRLMTLNGEEAKLLIGDRIPVVVEEVKDGEVTKTIEYIEAGITLEFKPWITSDNQIILEVAPRVSSIGESIGTSLPPINTREAETKIRLRDGETFAIGGLIRDDVIEGISKVPLLSEIPILGELFKHKDTQNIKTEVIIFITPHIVQEISSKDSEIPNRPGDIDNPAKEVKNSPGAEKDEPAAQEQLLAEGPAGEQVKEIETEWPAEIPGLTTEEIEEILKEERLKREGQEADNLPAYLNLTYTVKKNENIGDIALKYGLPVEDILLVNGLKGGEVESGIEIIIPVPKDHLYRVKIGETLQSISGKFAVSAEWLKEINNINTEIDLPAGMIIIIPKNIANEVE